MERQGGGWSLKEVLYGEAWPEVQFLKLLTLYIFKISYYAPVYIFVKSDTVVDGFGLNCLAWDPAPQRGKNKIGEQSKLSGSQEKGKGNRGSTALSPFPVHCSAPLAHQFFFCFTQFFAFFPTAKPFPMLNIVY